MIQRFLPYFDVTQRHEIFVGAGTDQTYAAIRTADLGSSKVTRFLLAARGRRTRGARLTFDDLLRAGFVVLHDEPGSEILLGAIGRFWLPRARFVRPESVEAFKAFDGRRYAKAAWHFGISPRGDGTCLLSTETRVQATDARARRAFRAYWLVIAPFSGMIRRRMLAAIKAKAESP